jgi:hypothetical protein
MRRYFSLFLLFLLSIPSLAQEDFPMPDLPDEPIFISDDIRELMWIEAYQFAWLDNQNLTFTFAPMSVPYQVSNPYTAYSYNLRTELLAELDASPFILDWNAEIQEYFQAGDYLIHRSPYPNENSSVPILYNSRLPEFGALFLYGLYWSDSEDYGSDQYPLRISPYRGFGFNLHWSSHNSAALIELGNEYSPTVSLAYINLSTGDIRILPFALTEFISDRAFGISPDGQRVILATDEFYTDNMNYSPELWQKLIIWDAPSHDDACACTYDPVSHVIYSEIDNEGKNFAGVGFVDENTILYIGNEGLFRHTISTGESVLLDPAFNTHWINLAIFSPDNRHVAVTTEQGLYVLPTGFEG